MGASTNTAVTYQGHLTANGIGVNGAYDLAFSLYENPAGGSQTGATVTNSSVLVSNGLFTTTLDFGSGVFTGEERWLEIAVRSGPAPFMVLSPRQPLSPAPYAISALKVSPGTFSGVFTGDGSGLTNLNLTIVTAATNDLSSVFATRLNAATNDLNASVSARMNAATNDLKIALSANINDATNTLGNTLSARIVGATNAPWIASTNWVASQGYQLTNGVTHKPVTSPLPSNGTNYLVDFNNEAIQLTATTNINFLASTNRTSAGWYAESVWYIHGGAANRTVRFNTNWVGVGTLATNAPYLVASNKLTIIAVSVSGPAETNVVYAIARQE